MRLHHHNPTLPTPRSALRAPRSGRRAGLSLTEVLVAIFIMGIGCLAILTLFPLGAMNMAQSIKDDRCAQAASQADSYMRWYWKNYAVETNGDARLAVASTNNAFENPGNGLTAPRAGEPSYPVCVDPMGYYARGGGTQFVTGTLIPRISLQLVNTQTNPSLSALRTCSLLDGFTFDPTQAGAPINPTTNQVDREYRYNWLWFLQRINNSDKATATQTIVVFNKRAHMYVPSISEVTLNPVAGGAAVGSNTLQFPAGTNTGLAKGGWILDATSTDQLPYVVKNCHFYRVVSVTDNPNTNTVDVELQTPLKPDTQPVGAAAIPANWRTFVVLAGVSEVFERPSVNGTGE